MTRSTTCLVYGHQLDSEGRFEAETAHTLRYAAEKGLEVAACFTDDQDSGNPNLSAFRERAGGRQLLAQLQSDSIGHVIVYKLEHIGRRARYIQDFIKELDGQQITIHIVDFGGESLIIERPQTRLILGLLAGFAEWEFCEIRDRTTKRLDSKRDNCEIVGTIPYGWTGLYTFGHDEDDSHVEETPIALNATQVAALAAEHGPLLCKRLHPERFEQAVIRWAVAQRFPHYPDTSRTGLGFNVIADALNSRAIPAKRGGKWQAGNVQGIIMGSYTQRMLAGTLPSELIADLRPEELL